MLGRFCLKEPDRLGGWAPRTWRRGEWSHGDRTYFPLRIGGNVGTLPNDPILTTYKSVPGFHPPEVLNLKLGEN